MSTNSTNATAHRCLKALTALTSLSFITSILCSNIQSKGMCVTPQRGERFGEQKGKKGNDVRKKRFFHFMGNVFFFREFVSAAEIFRKARQRCEAIGNTSGENSNLYYAYHNTSLYLCAGGLVTYRTGYLNEISVEEGEWAYNVLRVRFDAFFFVSCICGLSCR